MDNVHHLWYDLALVALSASVRRTRTSLGVCARGRARFYLNGAGSRFASSKEDQR
jgi:hypothetical protein